ncbi:hypothetical protein GCM10010967_41890 [Dyadobacter beijingensis]|uniref:Uncharacterized protein n=1 Tax=Dyadobacter beijingensis TaxID=365489 RepID=A0ABQ2I7I5_9BACT|nr:hypothetical protein [Dyadobacter beijingensis]GGN02874.1 hypothetical protein GCM10010967_41890 [Dyadobacter beijingensis]
MFKNYACILAMWLCAHFTALAQAPSISIDDGNFDRTTCLNKKVRLGIIVNGFLNTDNRFSIQIRKNETSGNFTEVPATMIEGKLEFVISDSLNYANNSVQLRVAASSPATLSDWSSSMTVFSKGRIVLNPNITSDAVNVFDDVWIRFSGYSLGK